MFSLAYIKLAVGLIALTIFIGLGLTARHYHNAWVMAEATIASKQMELDQALAAAKQCSDNTQKLSDAAKQKQEEVDQAQRQATLTAKKNKALASQILAAQSTNPNRCEAALDLINQHKSQTKGQ